MCIVAETLPCSINWFSCVSSCCDLYSENFNSHKNLLSFHNFLTVDHLFYHYWQSFSVWQQHPRRSVAEIKNGISYYSFPLVISVSLVVCNSTFDSRWVSKMESWYENSLCLITAQDKTTTSAKRICKKIRQKRCTEAGWAPLCVTLE